MKKQLTPFPYFKQAKVNNNKNIVKLNRDKNLLGNSGPQQETTEDIRTHEDKIRGANSKPV